MLPDQRTAPAASSGGNTDFPASPHPGNGLATSSLDTVEASARLTGMLGLILMVGLLVEGVTLLSIRHLVVVHIIVGLLLVPATLLKLGSVWFRFASYYAHHPEFRRAGPPSPLLRLMGPVVVASTVLLFASGIWLAAIGPGKPTLAAAIHKASFVIWFGAMSVHVLGHLRELPRTAFGDWITRGGRRVVMAGHALTPVRGTLGRAVAVVSAVGLGIALTIASGKIAQPWHLWGGG